MKKYLPHELYTSKKNYIFEIFLQCKPRELDGFARNLKRREENTAIVQLLGIIASCTFGKLLLLYSNFKIAFK